MILRFGMNVSMTDNPLRSNVRCAQETAGAYEVNRFWIRVNEWYWPFDDQFAVREDASPSNAAVLVHEYVHYLQNISTVTGFNRLSFDCSLLALFSRCLQGSVHSGGQEALSTEDREFHGRLIQFARTIRGSGRFSEPTKGRLDNLEITGVRSDTQDFQTPDGINSTRGELIVSAKLRFSDGNTEAGDYRLSIPIIEESLAYELEYLFTRACGEVPIDSPLDPYRVLREVAAYLWPDVTPEAIVRCGLYALQTESPAYGLGRLLCRRREPTVDEVRSRLRDAMPTVEKGLQYYLQLFEHRGLAFAGLQGTANQMRELMRRREEDPFFELALVEGTQNPLLSLADMFHAALPCDIIIEDMYPENELQRDAIFRFGEATKDRDLSSDGQRGFQAQLSACYAHIGADNQDFLPSSKARETKCPFFGACDQKQRQEGSDICRRRPWESAAAARGEAICWYGSGILGLLGLIEGFAKGAE